MRTSVQARPQTPLQTGTAFWKRYGWVDVRRPQDCAQLFAEIIADHDGYYIALFGPPLVLLLLGFVPDRDELVLDVLLQVAAGVRPSTWVRSHPGVSNFELEERQANLESTFGWKAVPRFVQEGICSTKDEGIDVAAAQRGHFILD